MPLFYKIIFWIGVIFLIFNAIIFIRALSKDKALIFFTFFLVFSATIQLLMRYIGGVLHENNLFMNNIFLVIQFVLLSMFYYYLLKKKVVLLVLLIGLSFLLYQYLMDLNLFSIYNPIGITFTQSIIIIYSLVYFYNSLNHEKPKFLLINIGVFLYLICSTLIYASGNLVFNVNIPENTYLLLLKVNAILYIIFQILIFIEWRKNYYKKTRRSS